MKRYGILDTITGPADLRGLSYDSLSVLCASLREFIVDSVSKTGGQDVYKRQVHSLARVAVVILLTAMARGFSAAAGGEADAWIDMAGALGCAAVLLQDFSGVLSLCRDTLEQISLFSGTLQPVLAAALSAGGSAATATVLQVATMVVFDLVIRLIHTLMVPAACALSLIHI